MGARDGLADYKVSGQQAVYLSPVLSMSFSDLPNLLRLVGVLRPDFFLGGSPPSNATMLG